MDASTGRLEKPRRRRWFRFTLRTRLIMVTVVSLLIVATSITMSSLYVAQAIQRSSVAQEEVLRANELARRQELRAERLSYANQLASAQQALTNGNHIVALPYLNQSRADFRGWEFNYLYDRATHGSRSLAEGLGQISCIAASGDGQYFVTGTRGQGTITLWNRESGGEIRRFEGHTKYVTSVAYSPSGQRLASGSFDKTVRVWDIPTGKELFAYEFPSHVEGYPRVVESVAFSPDGTKLVCGGQHSVARLLDAETGQLISTLPSASPLSLRHGDMARVDFSNDGTKIAGGTRVHESWGRPAKLYVWDAESGMQLLETDVENGSVNCLAFSPDGEHILTGSGFAGQTGELKIWNVGTGKVVDGASPLT